MPRRWLWGLAFGLLVGGCVVALSAARYGFSGPLIVLGIVLAIAFGGLGVIAGLARNRTTLD
jgi:hypothetical protein